MTDGQSLLLLFVVLYLIESLRWLPGRSWMLTGSGRRWQARQPFQPVEIAGGSPALLSVLPPLQTHLLTLPWLFVPSESGLEVFADDRRPPLLLPWTSLTPATEGRHLRLTTTCRVRCLSDRHAREAGAQIQRWLTLVPEAREQDFLDHARQTLAAQPLQDRASALQSQTRLLRHLGSLIFVWTFAVMAALYRWLGDSLEILIAASFLLLLQAVQAVLFYRRARGIPHRIWKSLATALLPQHAMRAADHLADVQTDHPSHPLAARPLLGDTTWRALALRFWKRIRYAPSVTSALQMQALETFFKSEGLAIEDLETPPVQQSGTEAYCPNCHAQFQAGATTCNDCGGIALKAFG